MGVLRFDGADWVRFSTLASGLANTSDAAWTCAVLVKQAVDTAGFQAYSYLNSAGPTVEAGVGRDGAGLLVADVAGYGNKGQDVVGTTETYIAVCRKAAGAGNVTYSLYSKSAGTWASEISAGTLADQIASTMLEIGTWQGGSDLANAWIGLVGWWEGAMSQANVETLDNTWSTSGWYSNAHATPTALIECNVAAASLVDLIGNATGLSVTGTPTLDAGETLASFDFNGTGSVVATSPFRPARPLLFRLQKFRGAKTPRLLSFPTPAASTAALGAFSLDAAPGAYVVTGVAADTLAGRMADATPGAYVLTGTAALPMAGRMVAALPGSYAVTGTAAALIADRMVAALTGTYTLTGTAAVPIADRMVAALPGVYTLTGTAALPAAGRIIDAAAGSYVLTGIAADLLYTPGLGAFVLNADTGVYVVTGVAAAPVAGRIITAAPGSYAVTGSSASLVAGRVIVAAPGSYVLTGTVASLVAGRVLTANPGSYVLSGVAANLVYVPNVGAFVLTADPGVYALTGTAAAPIATRLIVATPGSYTVAGVQAALTSLGATVPATLTITEAGTVTVTLTNAATPTVSVLDATGPAVAVTDTTGSQVAVQDQTGTTVTIVDTVP